jgi:hypothetical protein
MGRDQMKLLVSGCSFTDPIGDYKSWPRYLMAGQEVEVLNLGRGGAGNNYIANSVMDSAIDYRPDFVFILFSGIIRSDFRIPVSEIYLKNSNYNTALVGESLFALSGGGPDIKRGWLAAYNSIKDPSWPTVTSLQQWFDLPEAIKTECIQHKIHLSTDGGQPNVDALANQYFLSQNLIDNRRYHSELTFQHMTNCFNLLEKLNIPYRFSFIYDIWSNVENYSLGKAVKEKYYHLIDWTRFVDFPPLRYGLKNNFMSPDGFHLTSEGMDSWAQIVNQQLKQAPDLAHLFQ